MIERHRRTPAGPLALEYVACNCCNSTNLAAYCSAKSHYGPEIFQVVRCRDCRLIFVNPRLAGKREEIASRSAPALHPSPHEIARRRCYARLVLSKLSRYRRDGDFLDFGCGQGFLVHEAARAGWNAYGIELDVALAEAANAYWKTERILSWRLETLMLSGARFDAINASQVFEHLTDPLETARELVALLKEDGILSLDVPNVLSLRYLLGRASAFDPTAHLYHFSAGSLTRLLTKAGLEMLEVRTPPNLTRVMTRIVADPDVAASIAYRLSRLPVAGFGLHAVAVKRGAATPAAARA